jgi:hypothetical protein
MAGTTSTVDTIRRQRRHAIGAHPLLTGIDFIETRHTGDGCIDIVLNFVPADDSVPHKDPVPQGIEPRHVRIVDTATGEDSGLTPVRVSRPPAGRAGSVVVTARLPHGSNPADAHVTHALHLVGVPNVDSFFASATFSTGSRDELDYIGPDRPPMPVLEQIPQPHIDYLAKDYNSFRTLILDRLSQLVPDWTERNASDIGIALVEILAYAGDYLSYYQDAVGTEAYLETARRRVSVRRLARLLGYFVSDGCNARAWVHFQVANDTGTAPVILPEKLRLLTRLSGRDQAQLQDDEFENSDSLGLEVFETMLPVRLYAEHNEMRLYSWGGEDFVIEPGTTEATLSGHLANLAAGDVVIFDEALAENSDSCSPVDWAAVHIARLLEVELATDPLNGRPVTNIKWGASEAMQERIYVSCSNLESQSLVLRGNNVLADHGKTLPEETLPPVSQSSRYRPPLLASGLTFSESYDRAAMSLLPAGNALQQNPAKAVPAISLHSRQTGGIEARWTPRADLLNSGPYARDFKVETETDETAFLLFGDDLLGRMPDPGTQFTARYRVGNGPRGNVAQGAIRHFFDPDRAIDPTRIACVRNPMPAQGGTNPETIDHVRMYAPQILNLQQRCVTAEDYAAMARCYPGVRQAVARMRWTGSWQTVYLYVVRHDDSALDASFTGGLQAFIDRFRLTGFDVQIREPHYVQPDIEIEVRIVPGYVRSSVLQQLDAVFGTGSLPDGTPGFFAPDNFTFGQSLYLSQVIAGTLGVPGVAQARALRFDRQSLRAAPNVVRQVIAVSPLEIVRTGYGAASARSAAVRFRAAGETP